MEPVDSQQQKAQRFPPVVMPAKMSHLVTDHIIESFIAQGRGHIDDRSEYAQNKR